MGLSPSGPASSRSPYRQAFFGLRGSIHVFLEAGPGDVSAPGFPLNASLCSLSLFWDINKSHPKRNSPSSVKSQQLLGRPVPQAWVPAGTGRVMPPYVGYHLLASTWAPEPSLSPSCAQPCGLPLSTGPPRRVLLRQPGCCEAASGSLLRGTPRGGEPNSKPDCSRVRADLPWAGSVFS